MNKYDDMRIAAMKEYLGDKIDRITFDAKIAMINEQEEREGGEK